MISSSSCSLFLACITLFFPLPGERVIVTKSSANCGLIVSMCFGGGISLTKILKSIGPMTEPWGTPAFGLMIGPVALLNIGVIFLVFR